MRHLPPEIKSISRLASHLRGASLLFFIAVLLSGCQHNQSAELAFYQPIYTPEYASGFEILGCDSLQSTILRVKSPWQDSGGTLSELLILRNDETAPQGFDGQIISNSAQRIVAMSSTNIAMLDAFGASNTVVGVSGINFISSKSIRDRRDEIGDIGYDGNIDYERLVSLRPDLVLLYGVGSQSAMEPKLRELGIPFVYISDYLEQQPLGKAEWIIALGEITGLRHKAIDAFRPIPEKYNRLRALADSLPSKSRPKVMLNAPYGDSWFIPSPESYMVCLIKDAGADYVYNRACSSNASIAISDEQAILLTEQADFWLNVNDCNSIVDLTALCPKQASARCIANVYNNTRRTIPGHGNDFWESGAAHPDLILADLIKIFHPKLLPDHELYYYKPIH